MRLMVNRQTLWTYGNVVQTSFSAAPATFCPASLWLEHRFSLLKAVFHLSPYFFFQGSFVFRKTRWLFFFWLVAKGPDWEFRTPRECTMLACLLIKPSFRSRQNGFWSWNSSLLSSTRLSAAYPGEMPVLWKYHACHAPQPLPINLILLS